MISAPHHRVFAAFALYAFALGNLFPRLPEIKDAMGIEEGALGLALIGTPTGTLISLTFAPAVIARIGHRRALFWLTPLMAVFFALASQAPGPLAMFLLLVPAGLTVGAIETVVNVEADRVESRMDRRIMNRAHAFWSFGFFGAGLFGAVMAQTGVPVIWHLGLVVPLTILGLYLFLGGFEPAPRRGSDTSTDGPTVARPSWAIMALVGLCISAMLLEGAAIDWSAIYMVEVFAAAPFLGGAAVATGALSQALTRYNADRLVDVFSPVRVALAMQVAMALGVVTVFLSPAPWVSLVGFALIGGGTSVIFPLAMSAAAQRSDRPAEVNVAALAQFAFVVFLLAPPLLGFVAEHMGLRWTFGVALPLVAVSALLARSLAPNPEPQISRT